MCSLRGFLSITFCCGEASRVAPEELEVSYKLGEVLITSNEAFFVFYTMKNKEMNEMVAKKRRRRKRKKDKSFFLCVRKKKKKLRGRRVTEDFFTFCLCTFCHYTPFYFITSCCRTKRYTTVFSGITQMLHNKCFNEILFKEMIR